MIRCISLWYTIVHPWSIYLRRLRFVKNEFILKIDFTGGSSPSIPQTSEPGRSHMSRILREPLEQERFIKRKPADKMKRAADGKPQQAYRGPDPLGPKQRGEPSHLRPRKTKPPTR